MLTTNIIDFNIAAAFIFVMISFYIIYRKVYKSYSSRLFLLITVLYFFITVIDIFNSIEGFNPMAYKVLMFIYYVVKYLVAIIYLLYIILVTNTKGMLKTLRSKIILSIPFVVTIAFLIENLFTGNIYYFIGADYYRGNYIFVFYGLSFIYVAIGVVWLLLNFKVFSKSENVALFSVYAVSILALIIQYFYPKVLIEMLSTSLAILLLNITVERSQIIVDQKTGLKNKSNFKRTINSIFKRKEPHGLVIFYISNYLVLYEKFDYNEAFKQLRYFSSVLSRILIDDISYDTYYLENGLFGLITNDKDDAKRLANRLNSAIIREYDNKVIFNIHYVLCSSIIPEDFRSVNEFHEFMFNFGDSQYEKRVISVDEIKADVKHNIIIKLDDILDNVINNHDIIVEFQPIYNLNEKKFTVVEALARIIDNDLGIISADNFVPYAEKKDKMYEIDMIILEKVFNTYNMHKVDFIGIELVTINLSIQTISNPDFLSDLIRLERKYGIDKRMLAFEIKEREDVAFDKYDYAAITNLRNNGYSLSLDNYGVGCMPVDSLAKVPFANVKFDNIFGGSCHDKDTYVILDNTIKLFRKLNKLSVCAGVEDEKAANAIESLNPDYVQGFYYSMPLELEDLIKFLKNKNGIESK